jgi:hypothetical protein
MTISINNSDNLRKRGIKPYIVIGGKRHEMKVNDIDNNLFYYDYKIPDGVCKVPYYYELVRQVVDKNGSIVEREVEKTELFNLSISDKYVLGMDCKRGPVGARVCILGSGFLPRDMIRVGGVPARVNNVTKGAIEFTIPLMDAGTFYDVILISGEEKVIIDKFFIDVSKLGTDVESIRIGNGEKAMLSFFIDHDAPEGGIDLDITTDIPDSVIMPEVRIPEGSRFAEVQIEGSNNSDVGSLFVYARGFNELKIPIEVGENASMIEESRYNRVEPKRQERRTNGRQVVDDFNFDDKEDDDMVVVR